MWHLLAAGDPPADTVQATATLAAAAIAAVAALASVAVTAWIASRSRKQVRDLDTRSRQQVDDLDRRQAERAAESERKADERFREFTGREQWWTRFSWAMEKAMSAQPREYEMGLGVLIALIGVSWASEEDNEMALAIADMIVSQEGGEADD